jgi:hypothetical protein
MQFVRAGVHRFMQARHLSWWLALFLAAQESHPGLSHELKLLWRDLAPGYLKSIPHLRLSWGGRNTTGVYKFTETLITRGECQGYWAEPFLPCSDTWLKLRASGRGRSDG